MEKENINSIYDYNDWNKGQQEYGYIKIKNEHYTADKFDEFNHVHYEASVPHSLNN